MFAVNLYLSTFKNKMQLWKFLSARMLWPQCYPYTSGVIWKFVFMVYTTAYNMVILDGIHLCTVDAFGYANLPAIKVSGII